MGRTRAGVDAGHGLASYPPGGVVAVGYRRTVRRDMFGHAAQRIVLVLVRQGGDGARRGGDLPRLFRHLTQGIVGKRYLPAVLYHPAGPAKYSRLFRREELRYRLPAAGGGHIAARIVAVVVGVQFGGGRIGYPARLPQRAVIRELCGLARPRHVLQPGTRGVIAIVNRVRTARRRFIAPRLRARGCVIGDGVILPLMRTRRGNGLRYVG